MLNNFASQKFVEEKILDPKGKVVGIIRIKPSGVLWKPKGSVKFYSVDLETFTKWITARPTKAAKTIS